jgi:AraC family transcriptional regulator
VAKDRFWNDVVAWAKRNHVSYRPLAIAISYDDPTVTPPSLQRLDACVPIDSNVTPRGQIRRVDFTGGRYGGIEHIGPYSTIDQAYRNLADGIRRSRRYDFDEGPPVQIYRKIHIGGDPQANVTEVYFPIRSVA